MRERTRRTFGFWMNTSREEESEEELPSADMATGDYERGREEREWLTHSNDFSLESRRGRGGIVGWFTDSGINAGIRAATLLSNFAGRRGAVGDGGFRRNTRRSVRKGRKGSIRGFWRGFIGRRHTEVADGCRGTHRFRWTAGLKLQVFDVSMTVY